MFLPSIAERHLHKAGTYLCLLENFFPDVIKIYWKEKDGDKILDSYQGDTVQTQDTYMTFSLLTVSGKSMDKEHKCMVKHEKNKGGVDQEILFPPINKGVILKETTEASVKGGSGVIPTVFMEPSLKNQNGVEMEAAGCFLSWWVETGGVFRPGIQHSESTHQKLKLVPSPAHTLPLGDRPFPSSWCSTAGLNADALKLQLINTSAYYTYLLLLVKSTVYFAIIMFCLKRMVVCGHEKGF
ncbi:T-cell receptor gamma alternate reading frame protein isoform X2 [Tamandua tetradactyla]|uniref:T-cell receptor gamma alternate reading frame protein isoform X2 n=1 Tax=Tamandua tetradactyla TaxID=48850 RepID=UPI004053C723